MGFFCKIFQLLWPLPNDDFYRKSYTGKWDNAGLVSLVKITKACRKVDPQRIPFKDRFSHGRCKAGFS